MVNGTVRKILIGTLFVSLILGCATIPIGPLQINEVRLTKLSIIEKGGKGGKGKYYNAITEYQQGERIKPDDIKLTCTTWYWEG